jgi:alpha-D-ribose 1-methylphosphonate 5-triphosphate diphosphatase
MASHDDDSPQRVQVMSAFGVTVSEFPVNSDAARASFNMGLWTVFGAPNILRGGSQNGSMKALEAVQEGVAGCLCSDYHPGALLAAVFQLHRRSGIGLADAVRLVTTNPAKATGCEDRGSIEVGKKADLAGVRLINEMACVSYLWVNGNLRFQQRI